jgi:hypothetical protein
MRLTFIKMVEIDGVLRPCLRFRPLHPAPEGSYLAQRRRRRVQSFTATKNAQFHERDKGTSAVS